MPLQTNDVLTKVGTLVNNERRVITIALCALIGLTVYDYFEDRAQGASKEQLLADISDLILPFLLLIYIWRIKPLELFRKTNRLEKDLAQKHADLEQWKSKASRYLKGLAETIDQQFDGWHLSFAEKEVALLLLKGFSLQEIADIRGVSERTARQQATRVYDKAGLRGRAELSAYFLEDLMLPAEPAQN